MNASTPVNEEQLKRDTDHINLLSVFHFVIAGLALFGIAFLILHYWMMSSVFMNPAIWKSEQNSGPPPKEFFDIFVWFYLFMGVVIAAGGVLNILSGVFLRQRKFRMFSFVVAGLNCLQIPFGTVLGIFTIMVMSRDSVRKVYGY